MLLNMGKVNSILLGFLENHHRIVAKLKSQTKPATLNGDVMYTSYINMCWCLNAIDVGVERITSSRMRT
jgi:hypothetical protein